MGRDNQNGKREICQTIGYSMSEREETSSYPGHNKRRVHGEGQSGMVTDLSFRLAMVSGHVASMKKVNRTRL